MTVKAKDNKKATTKTVAKTTAKPAVKATPKTTPKVTAKPATKPVIKVAPKAATKPKPKTPAKKPKEAPVKRGAFRPSLYREEYNEQMLEYFNIEVSEIVEVEVSGKVEQRERINKFPTLTRFASNIGVTRETLYNWAHDRDKVSGELVRPEFFHTYTRCMDLQESLIIEGGMSGKYETKALIFLAPNISRLKNKVETTADVTVISTTTDELDEIYAKAKSDIEEGRVLGAGRAERLGLNVK